MNQRCEKWGAEALRVIALIVLISSLAGCASFGRKLKDFLGGKKSSSTSQQVARKPNLSFNQQPNYLKSPRRQYKRMTKEKLEKEAQLGSESGSLWVMEGQGAYLFSQNIIRMIGDPISVRIEGDPRQQLSAKADTIRGLLEKIKTRRQELSRKLASKKSKKTTDKKAAPEKVAKTSPNSKNSKSDASSGFKVKTVPTRIVERLLDGSYRVKGGQPFMIDGREYKVIVTGVIRAEDFSDDGINASQLLDPKFDIVSTRKREARL